MVEDSDADAVAGQEVRRHEEQSLLCVLMPRQGFSEATGCVAEFWALGLPDVVIAEVEQVFVCLFCFIARREVTRDGVGDDVLMEED